MKWYVASLVMECRVAREEPELWDEQIVVIRAVEPDAAHKEAIRLGRIQKSSYKNGEGQTVTWRFLGVAQLEELNHRTITSGTEIFSRLSRDQRPELPAKRNLLVFWTARNLHKTTSDLLSEKAKTFAPR